jgi:hypothetical protein
MIVVTRNGKRTVYTGWQAWLISAVAFAVLLLVFAMAAAFLLGFAITLWVLLVLAIPAMLVVSAVTHLLPNLRR